MFVLSIFEDTLKYIKMIGRLIILVLCLISFAALTAQNVIGDWEGQIAIQGTELKVIFHVTQGQDGLESTLDSPNQGAFDIEMDETVYQGDTLTIKSNKLNLVAALTYDEDQDELEGQFNQGPLSTSLKLERLKEKQEVASNHPMAGDWNSELDVMGTQLRIVFHITESDGIVSTTMDSPDQGAYGIKLDTTIVDDNEISLASSAMRMDIKGTYVPDSNIIRARFKQGPLDEEIVLSREEIEKKEVVRPQEPTVFDYTVEDVKWTNPKGGHELAGTLTIPKSGTFEKVVILVSGSGPQDRNEELLGHKPFLVLSDHLTRNGIAVLRYDDRGVGASTGDFGSATSMDFAEDATSAVNYLRSRKEMQGKLIGVMGHSEGGLIAPIVADLTDLDFAVLLAGPGIDSDVLLLEQTEAISMASGADKADVDFSVASSRKMFEFIKRNQDLSMEDLKEGMDSLLRIEFAKLSEEDLEKVGDVDAEITRQIESIAQPWFRYFIAYSPSVYLQKLDIPTLAVNGSLDLQVLSESNLKGIEENLKIAGNDNFVIKEFEGLNHLFQVSKNGTGSPSEYGGLEETFNEDVMQFITEWISNFDK